MALLFGRIGRKEYSFIKVTEFSMSPRFSAFFLRFLEYIYFPNNMFLILKTAYGDREHIRCQPTSPCKLWKLQSGPSDQHPRGGGAERWEGDLQKCDYPIQGRIQIVKLINPSYPLDVGPMTQIEVTLYNYTERLVCT